MIDRRSGKPKRVSKSIQEAVTLIESGAVRTIKAAAQRAGLSNYVVTALQMPHVQAFIARKKRQNLAAAALRGSQRALELVDSPSERTSIEATKLVLAIDGFRPETSPLVNINLQGDVKAGYIIDLSGVDRSSPDVIEGEVVRDESHLSSSAPQALDSKPGAEPTSYQPDSRWAQTVTTPAPAEPEPREPDAFDQAAARQEEREMGRAARPAGPLRTHPPRR